MPKLSEEFVGACLKMSDSENLNKQTRKENYTDNHQLN